jgi:hypothetical protein
MNHVTTEPPSVSEPRRLYGDSSFKPREAACRKLQCLGSKLLQFYDYMNMQCNA